MTEINLLAVQCRPVLRAIADGGHATLTALADAAGRGVNNLNATLKSMETGSLIAYPAGAKSHQPVLTDLAREQLAMFERAEAGDTSVQLPPNTAFLRSDQIIDGPNARTTSGLTEASIVEMADDLLDKGMLQPIKVRPAGPDGLHVRVMGERRHRGWRHNVVRGAVPADHLELVLLHDGDELSARLAGLSENLQRADLTQLEYGEEFARLQTEFNLSNAEIAARVPGISKRSVDDYLKVAREASDENKAKYLASVRAHEESYDPVTGRRDPKTRTFTWEQLRDTVGDKAPKLSLILSPRLSTTLAEIIHAQGLRGQMVQGEPGCVRLATPPTGGPIDELVKKGLLSIRVAVVEGVGAAFVKPRTLSTAIDAWLGEIGYKADPEGTLDTLRAKDVGDLQAHDLRSRGVYATDLLNLPATAELPAAPEPAHAVRHDDDIGDDDCFVDADQVDDGHAATDHEPPPEPVFAAGAGDGETPPPPPPALPSLLDDREALLLLEVAHKISVAGVEPPGRGYRGCFVGPTFRDDKVAQDVIDKRCFSMGPSGQGTSLVLFLTALGRQELADRNWQNATAVDLMEARRKAGFSGIPTAGTRIVYETGWLNPEPEAAAARPVAAPQPAAAAQPTPQTATVAGMPSLSQMIAAVRAEDDDDDYFDPVMDPLNDSADLVGDAAVIRRLAAWARAADAAFAAYQGDALDGADVARLRTVLPIILEDADCALHTPAEEEAA